MTLGYNTAYLQTGNRQLEDVLKQDPASLKDPKQVRDYLFNKPVKGAIQEKHRIGYATLVQAVVEALTSKGIAFLTYGNTATEEDVKRESSNLASFAASIYEKIKAASPNFTIATDLLPASCQNGIDDYTQKKSGRSVRSEALENLLAPLSDEYKAKAMFALPLLDYARKYGLKVVALDSKFKSANLAAAIDSRTTDMADLIKPGTLVIVYDDLVRNQGLLPAKLVNRYTGLGVSDDKKIVRVSQVPSKAVLEDMQRLHRTSKTPNAIIDLTYFGQPAEYFVLGKIGSINPDDPKIIYRGSQDNPIYIATHELTDPRLKVSLAGLERKLSRAERARTAANRRAGNLSQELIAAREELTALREAPSAAPQASSATSTPPLVLSDTDNVCRIVANQLKKLGLSLGPVLDEILEGKLAGPQIDEFAATPEGQEYIRLIDIIKGAQ
ncbi:TPA: hypothetical protein HA246_01190 [Candidatus Woesearchaeota archaeon]|nr:hypothetical protein [Candidatus Woesearchaeota archaeon]